MARADGKRRWKPWRIIALALFAFAILGGGIFALAISLTRPVAEASDTFMTAVKDGDFETAYGLGTPALREELGSVQGLGAIFDRGRPATWSWSSRRIRNGTGSVSGSVVYSSGAEGDVEIFLLPDGDGWKISGFRMNPQ